MGLTMGIGDALGNAYMKVEDAYYGVLDFFEGKGIGAPWAYNDFLESKGVPALPVTIALIILLVGAGLFVTTANQPQDISFTLELNDDKGRGLEDVTIQVLDADGQLLKTLTASDGTVITLTGIQGSGPLTIQASKEGYGNRSGFFYVGDEQLALSLEGDNDAVVGRLRMVDAETRTTITSATIRAEWAEGAVPLLVNPGADGIALLNVPLNREIIITVDADNYEQLVDTLTFANGDVKIKELAPKASASSGPSLLTVKTLDARTQLPMEDVHIRIENQLTNEVISDLDVASGIHSENLTKGLVVRVSASKEGYVTYASTDDFPEGKTLRKDEELILAPLETGGTDLIVHTQNSSNQQALQGVDIDLIEAGVNERERQTTGFTGDATFNGLLQSQAYTLLAFHPNFFPTRTNVNWSTLTEIEEGKRVAVEMKPFTSGDASVLTVFVTEEGGKAASLARLTIDEKVEGEWIPLVGARSVDSVGSFTARVPVGTTVRITADTPQGSASQEATLTSGLNKIVLTLNQNTKPVTLNLSYANGTVFAGKVEITSSGGTEWFNGASTNGTLSVLLPTSQPLSLKAISTDGKSYVRTITITPENDTMTIVLDSTAGTTGTAPEMVFEGLFGADGQSLPGLSPSEDAFARFTIRWPANADRGGFHVRVGEDAIASVDSQFGGIFGLNGNTDSLSYGRSWNPAPAPGNEAKDRKTRGNAGALSKWVEGIVVNPIGTQTIDVRMKARAGTPDGVLPLAYRAFVERNGTVSRTPADPTLGEASYTANKSGLYASTLRASIPVYGSLPLCHGTICASIQLVDKDNRLFPVGSAQVQNGELYAIQVTVLPGVKGTTPPSNTATASNTGTALTSTGEGLIPLPNQPGKGGLTLKVNTSNENPLLVFTKTEVNTFGALVDTGKKDTSVTLALPGTDSPAGAHARVQFLPEEVGQTSISVQLVSTQESWDETIPLSIVTPRLLSVSIPPSAEPQKPISVNVLDDQGNAVTDALITFTRADGVFAASVKGNGTLNRGENGRYVIDKSFGVGIYGVRVRVPGFVDAEETLVVGIQSPLELPAKIAVNIPFGQTTSTQTVVVRNRTAYPLSNVSGEFLTVDQFPNELSVEVGILAAIAPNGSGNLVLTARYAGKADDTTVRIGTGTLRVHGDAVQTYEVEGESQLSVGYNSPLDATCLQFDKEKLSVYVMGEAQPYGNMYAGSTSQANANVPYYGFSQTGAGSETNAPGYNAYGYGSDGYYQNAETKRLSVKATNNCGVELNLIPGISIVDGQAEVDGLKLAAVDSALKLGKGETKQVDFSLTNDLYRAGFAPQSARFAATFRAPQLNVSIPIEVTFWDRSRAIQTANSIELTLVKTGSQKAMDRALVPITNVGAGPIYDLRAQLQGDSASDITFRLENNPSGTGSTASSGTNGLPLLVSETTARGSLQPGQTLYPPLAIVGESTREMNTNVERKLIISGVIEGRRVTLREIPVFARTGSSSCLEISAFDTPVSFVSSELVGTISKRVTIQNKCLEPVRITQITPNNAGVNTFTLTPLEGGDTLDKDAEQEYQLLLTKAGAVNVQVSIRVSGVLILSQRGIESNPLPVEVRLGANELQSTNASNPVEVPVCEGGTMSVRFPLLAKKDECAQAYCDAQQASTMLANVMEQTLAKVVQQMQSKRNDASEFPNCDLTQRYCTFAELGIKSPKIEVYLQHDALTPPLLTRAMRDGSYPRLASMQGETLMGLLGDGADSAFLQKLGNGFGNKVFLPEIRGCGYYQFSLVGGVEVAANQLQPGQVNMGFVLTNPKQNTAECQDKIYNAANFLPKDRSLTGSNTQGTLLGMVEYENGLQQAGEWLAETVFGSDSRATTNTGSNRVRLRTGNLAQSIIEMTLDSSTQGDLPKSITTTIRQTNGTVQKEVVIEAGKIITSLGKNVNGCITRDEQTWRIYSAKDVGQFTFEGCMLPGTSEGGLAVRSTLTCCTLTAKSDILSDASYTLDPRGTTVPGLVAIDLYEVGTPATSITPAKPGTKIENNSPYELVFDAATQTYEKQILLCATADPRTQQQANRAIVQTSAMRTLDDTKAGPQKIELRTCSLDADDALAKAYGKGTGTWYATIDWDDPTASKTILQTVEEATQNEKLGNAYVSYAGQGILANDNPVYEAKLNDKKMESVGNFGLACALTCGVCQGGFALATFGTSLGAGALDCLITCGAGTAVGAYEVYKENAEGTILETPKDIVEFTYGNARDLSLNLVPGSGENEEGASALVAGTLASGIKSVYRPLKSSKDAKEAIFTYSPKRAIKDEDLTFLNDAQAEIGSRTKTIRDAGTEWNLKFVEKDEKARITVARKPLPAEAAELDRKLGTLTSTRTKVADGYDGLIKKYKGTPGFDEGKVLKAKDDLLAQIDTIEKNITDIKAKVKGGKLAAVNDVALTRSSENAGKIARDSIGSAQKINVPEKFYQTKKATALKNFGRGLVCGGVGSIAGYAAYRETLTEEIENKIELDIGSDKVLDPQTNVLTFNKGQTYQFNVQPATGTGTSRKIFIDVVSPDAQLASNVWLDDCATK